MPLYRERGVVLRTYRLGETDRIVSLLTETRGKVRAVAKGVRKPGSRFGARLEPTSHVSLILYEGRNLDTITQADSIDSFKGLRTNLDALTAAMAVLEVTDQAAQEQEANGPLYRMLVGAMRVLSEEPSALVAPAYFWKLLSLEGFHPQLDSCVRCGADDRLVALIPEADGAVCGSCAPHRPGTDARAALEMIGAVLGGGLRSALEAARSVECTSGPVIREVERLAFRAVEFHFERRLRSAGLVTHS